VLIWREFRTAPAGTGRLLVIMFLFFLAGLGLIALAPLYAGVSIGMQRAALHVHVSL
jgi:hypothetical protein